MRAPPCSPEPVALSDEVAVDRRPDASGLDGAVRATFEALSVGVLAVTIEGEVVTINAAAERILGLDRLELTRWVQAGEWVVYREDGTVLPVDERPIARTLTTGECVRGAIVAWRLPSGRFVTMEASTDPVRDDEGNVVAVVVSLADVTEHRSAAKAAAEAEDQLRRSFDASVIGMALLSIDGQFLRVNPAFAEMLGRTPDELAGQPSWSVVHPDDQPTGVAAARQVLEGEAEASQTDVRLVRADGSFSWGRCLVSRAVGADGTASVLVQVEDVTGERDAREEARRANARFAALVERSSDVICLLGVDGTLLYSSPAGQRMLGFAVGTRVGRPFTDLVHRDDLATVTAAFDALLSASGETRAIECRVAAAAGGWRHVEVLATNRLEDPDVAGIVANVRDVTDRAEAAARVRWQAFHDPLTGLPNRALLLDRLGQAVERARRFDESTALLYIDLDRFKAVNDSLGHAAGDHLLVEVASRLLAAVRDGDTVARLGGDEFVVLTERLGDPEEATLVARRINTTLAQPVELPGEAVVTLSASIGVAFDLDHRPDTLLRDADNALYQAKARGKNRYEVFDDGLRAEVRRRVATEQRLRLALDGADGTTMAVHYQPIFDLASGAVIAAEALMRMPGRHGGFEPPASFIPVAEESGLIIALGAGVLDDACRELAAWQRELGTLAPRQVNVNVSARQLSSPGFLGLVQTTLGRRDVDPKGLIVEFTESTIIGADRSTTRAVEALHELGVRLAVDDFGTGYSSLQHLKRFPVDIVKLDQSFVHGLGVDQSDTEIVRAVLSLGHSLGLQTIAEGIETAEQLEALHALGCGYGQGYFLAVPAPAAALGELTSRWTA